MIIPLPAPKITPAFRNHRITAFLRLGLAKRPDVSAAAIASGDFGAAIHSPRLRDALLLSRRLGLRTWFGADLDRRSRVFLQPQTRLAVSPRQIEEKKNIMNSMT